MHSPTAPMDDSDPWVMESILGQRPKRLTGNIGGAGNTGWLKGRAHPGRLRRRNCWRTCGQLRYMHSFPVGCIALVWRRLRTPKTGIQLNKKASLIKTTIYMNSANPETPLTKRDRMQSDPKVSIRNSYYYTQRMISKKTHIIVKSF